MRDFRGLSAGSGAYLRDGVPAWLCLCESISQTGADACGLAGTLYFLCGQLHGRSPGKRTEQQDTARYFKEGQHPAAAGKVLSARGKREKTPVVSRTCDGTDDIR